MQTQGLWRLIAVATMVGVGSLSAQQRPVDTRGVSLALVCGAQASYAAPVQAIRVTAGTETRKELFSAGETLIINAGTSQGIRTGQQFYVRRVVADELAVPAGDSRPFSIHTAGWVTIRDTQTDSSVAVVSEACDGISVDDYLEPLVLPVTGAEIKSGEPDYARPAHVMLGDERRQLGSEGSLMLIDRGSDHGLRPGQRLTLFRPSTEAGGSVVKIGEAVVASTQHETSVMRIGATSGEIQLGDLVAIHR